MRMSLVSVSVVLVSALTGCTSSHATTDVASGIYELTVTSERDACTPTRETGSMGRVAVVSAVDVLNLGLQDGARVSLDQSNGFHAVHEVPFASCVGASLRREWAVVASDASGGFTVAYNEEWTGLARCSMPEAPRADCRADLVLSYRNMEACAAPCTLSMSASGPSCLCE
jgi:hypothetical protein